MSEHIVSAILGFIFTCSFFVISFFVVVGAKSVYNFVKSKLLEAATFTPIEKPAVKKRKKRKPVRSIEINPEETTRIVVKKTG